jgi:hypothetical protein
MQGRRRSDIAVQLRFHRAEGRGRDAGDSGCDLRSSGGRTAAPGGGSASLYDDAANAAAAKHALGLAPSRDARYLYHYTGQAPYAQVASNPRVADRWYEDATTSAASPRPVVSAPPIRDAWYLDHSAAVTAPALSQQARDTLYLDSANDAHRWVAEAK